MMQSEEDSREAVAARLERVRVILGMSKREFAEKAGISEQGYGAFIHLRRDVTLDAAKKFRKVYGLPLEFTYFGIISDLPHRIATDL